MNINLSATTHQRLAEHASAAGYPDVEKFAAEHLQAIASEPTPRELPPLSEAERTLAAALIEEGEADLAAGRVRDMREAMRDVGKQFGFCDET